MKKMIAFSILAFVLCLIYLSCKKNSSSNIVNIDKSILKMHTWYADSALLRAGITVSDSTMFCMINCSLVFTDDSDGYFNDSTSVCRYTHNSVPFKYYIASDGTSMQLNYATSINYAPQDYDIIKVSDSELVMFSGNARYVFLPR